MWSILERRVQVTILISAVIYLLIAIQALIPFISDAPISSTKFVSIIIFIVATLFVGAFNLLWRRLWRRYPVLGKLIFPDLQGTWEGTIQTSWKNPDTGLVPGPIATIVWIRQDLLSISVRQQTKESPSWSTRMVPAADRASGRYQLWYSYDNKPHANVSSSSPDHEGVCTLENDPTLNPSFLKGQYYTSRKTTGNISLTRRSREIKPFADKEDWTSGTLVNDFRSVTGA